MTRSLAVDSLYGCGCSDQLTANDGVFSTAGRVPDGTDCYGLVCGTGPEQVGLVNTTLQGIKDLCGFSGGAVLTAGQLAAFNVVDTAPISVAGRGSIDLTGTAIRTSSTALAYCEATSPAKSAGCVDTTTGSFVWFRDEGAQGITPDGGYG